LGHDAGDVRTGRGTVGGVSGDEGRIVRMMKNTKA